MRPARAAQRATIAALSVSLFAACDEADAPAADPPSFDAANYVPEFGMCGDWAEAGELCGVFLPPVVNETTWSDAQLADVWTYRATDHNMGRLRDEAISHALAEADTADAAAFESWRAGAAEAFDDLLRMDAASWPDTPLLVRELEVEQGAGYTLKTIDYVLEPGQRVPASLFIPDGLSGPAPALVIWHGHNDLGRLDVVEARTDGAFNRYAEGARRLAEEGYIVLAPEIRSFGETGSPRQHEHYVQQSLLHGRVAVGQFVADAQKALDVLQAMPEVDPDRLGMGGTSLGGEVTLFTAAVDPRVRAATVAGYLASYRETTLGLWHCVCQYIANFGRTLDFADVAALAAPTPLQFVTGQRDGIFPVDEARAAFDRLAPAWDVMGARSDVDLHVHPGEHEWIHDVALAHFDRVLRPAE